MLVGGGEEGDELWVVVRVGECAEARGAEWTLEWLGLGFDFEEVEA